MLASLLQLLVPLLIMGEGGDAPLYNSSGELLRPENYREWVFLSSGIGMTYGPNAPQAAEHPRFDNVFVNPASWRAFKETGRWPDKTVFVLEIRSSESKGSINRGGHYQAGLAAIEVEVKDESRSEMWAYYDFAGGQEPLKASARSLGPKSNCTACHSTNGAVESTFVQFYPIALEIAKTKGTLKQ